MDCSDESKITRQMEIVKIIVYAAEQEDYVSVLEKEIHSIFPELKISVFNAIDRLSQFLRQPLHNVFIAILLPASRTELAHLIGMAVLFDNVRVILILPDRSRDTRSLGLTLSTSFISYVDNNVKDVVSVLRHLIEKKWSIK